jgi:hypothetical protein
MWKLVLDENFDNRVMRGLQRRLPDELDMIRAQDVEAIYGKDDITLLTWCDEHERILLTHDVRTITKYAYERIDNGERMLGIIEVKRRAPLGLVIDELVLLFQIYAPADLAWKIFYIPM